MNEKFNDVPLDDDTTILYERILKDDKYEALYQIWSWEGITAQCMIFLETDVEELSDNDLEKIVKSLIAIDEKTKFDIKRNAKGYTFVNFSLDEK